MQMSTDSASGGRASFTAASTRPEGLSATHLVVLVGFGSLLAGLGEFGARVAVHRWSPYLDKSFHLNPQAVWMAPLAALPLIALGVAAAWLVSRSSRTPALRHGLPLATVLFLAAWQVVLTTTRVHPAALALLALGTAIQLTRFAFSHPSLTVNVIRRSTIAMAAVSLLGGLGWNIRIHVAESRAYQSLPSPAAGAPNVLLLILDTVRASELSVYGYKRRTSPFLEELAASGIRFDRALSTAPWTLPSHASFFTGRYPHELRVGWNSALDDSHRTLAEAFATSGFATGGFVANRYYGPWLFGLDRGFHHYADYAMSSSELLGQSNLNRRALSLWNELTGQYWRFGRKSAADVNEEFLSWLDRRPAGRPFFAFLNYIDAHTPYVPPAPYRMLYLEKEPPTRRANQGTSPSRPDPRVTSGLRDSYDGAITYLDAQLRQLDRDLEARGLAANTVVLVSSDHGEEFGEHGFVEHGVSLYLPELHVPLIMRLVGKEHRGCVVRDWVTLRDIPATLTNAARLELATPFPGHSLIDRCSDPASSRAGASPLLAETTGRQHLAAWYPSSEGDIQGLMFGDLHFMKIGSGKEHLFDTSIDFAQQRDLSRDPAFAAATAAARAALVAARR